MRRRRAWVAGMASAVLVSTAGCSALTTGGAADAPAMHLAQVSQRSMGEPARVRVAHVHAIPRASTDWSVVGVDPASTTISMTWTDGFSPECGEADRVEVVERSDTVAVGVSDSAADPSAVCAAVGIPRRFDLRLRRPLGGRALVEPVTGVNDGLPHFGSGTPPVPTCSTNATPADPPIGMLDAAMRLAPRSATHATICRTAWPHGRARTTETQLSDPRAVAALVRTLNGATRLRAARNAPTGCDTRSPGSWYAVYLAAPHIQVEVFVDEINCATITNGVLQGSVTPAIERALQRAFRS